MALIALLTRFAAVSEPNSGNPIVPVNKLTSIDISIDIIDIINVLLRGSLMLYLI